MSQDFPTISNLTRNFFLVPILFFVHIGYEVSMGHWLFKEAGGIKEYEDSRWTELGGIDWAYETP